MIIKDTTVIKDDQTILKNHTIIIRNGKIDEVCPSTKTYTVEKNEEIIDGKGKWFMPGLVDAHTHIGQQLLKGCVLDEKPIIWTRIMLPFESTLDEKKMELMAELAALEMIKSGTVGFVDSGSYFMESALKVLEKSGLIGAITASTMDDPGLPKSIRTTCDEAVQKLDQLYDKKATDRIKVYYSLRALNNCSNDLILKVFEHAKKRNTYVVAHMNEYQKEVDGIIDRTGKVPYEFLDQLNVLNERFIGAHSLILTENEKELIREKDIKICHCPFSNCGKAVPDTVDLIHEGIAVGMGTDGAAHGGLSLWNEMKIFRSVMNICRGVPANQYDMIPAESILKMASFNGYRLLDEKAGRIEKGYEADMIGIDANSAALIPTGNIIHTLLESVNANDVSDMIVRGRVLMKDREILTLDEEKIMAKAKAYMR